MIVSDLRASSCEGRPEVVTMRKKVMMVMVIILMVMMT